MTIHLYPRHQIPKYLNTLSILFHSSTTQQPNDPTTQQPKTFSGAQTLVNPEPNFFVLGIKSYGRNSAFLLRTGLEQVRALLSLLEADA
jgi:hypothetical protein